MEMKPTREQVEALYSIYKRSRHDNPDRPSSYLQFRREAIGPIRLLDGAIMVEFCGMTLGVERDGYTHS
jgi:hypothetical protein